MTEFEKTCPRTPSEGLTLLDFDLTARAKIENHLAEYEPVVSDLNFTAMFMWRNFFRTSYIFIGKYLCIICGSRDFMPYALPPVGPDDPEALTECIAALREYFNAFGFALVIKNADDVFAEKAARLPDVTVTAVPDRDNADYLYRTADLVELAGKKYDGKRNHIKRFEKSYNYIVETFTGADIPQNVLLGCKAAVNQWSDEHDCAHDEAIYFENQANNELLDNLGGLNVKGIAVLVDGKVAGFSIGSRLNSTTTVIHAEKADNRYNGIYAFLNREFVRCCWQDTAFVNREEDLGIEGIRRAKLSYNPYRLIDKHILTIR